MSDRPEGAFAPIAARFCLGSLLLRSRFYGRFSLKRRNQLLLERVPKTSGERIGHFLGSWDHDVIVVTSQELRMGSEDFPNLSFDFISFNRRPAGFQRDS